MALLQVRNFPDDKYELISQMARKERRSIAQQTILLIEKGLEEETPRERRIKALQRSMAREIPESMKNFDVVASIREDRDR
jgi:hypothetical protein